MVRLWLMASVSDLRREFVQQRLVGVAVDFAQDQLLGASHGQRGYLLAQVLAGAVAGGHDLGGGGGLLPVALLDRLFLGVVDDLRTPGLGLGDDLGGLDARFAQHLVHLLLGLGQILLAAVSRSEAFGDLLLAFLDRR